MHRRLNSYSVDWKLKFTAGVFRQTSDQVRECHSPVNQSEVKHLRHSCIFMSKSWNPVILSMHSCTKLKETETWHTDPLFCCKHLFVRFNEFCLDPFYTLPPNVVKIRTESFAQYWLNTDNTDTKKSWYIQTCEQCKEQQKGERWTEMTAVPEERHFQRPVNKKGSSVSLFEGQMSPKLTYLSILLWNHEILRIDYNLNLKTQS